MADPSPRPLLVGETNPLSDEPGHALYPYPPNCSGERLQRLVLALPIGAYLRRYERVDLCVGRWSIVRARARSLELLEVPRPAVVLLGAKVAAAFGVPFEPYQLVELRGRARLQRGVVLPHPSGLCRLWHEPGAYDRARAALAEAGALDPPPRCARCAHPPHLGLCTARSGGTAYACGCSYSDAEALS